MKGTFVMVDGMDGSGKSVVIGSLESWARSHSYKILNLEHYCDEKGALPGFDEIYSADVIVASEPTPVYVGKAIKEEMVVQTERKYSSLSLSHAFALDREIVYNRVIIPALKAGKIVFQDRGIVTSLVYQPAESKIALIDLLRLPGNKLAMDYAPDLLIITRVTPEAAMQRIEERKKKTIFENLLFQRKISERYSSMWLKQLFENMKSTVVYIDTNPPKSIEDTSREAISVWEDFLKKRDAKPEEPRKDHELPGFETNQP
jgi:dTMP kinase